MSAIGSIPNGSTVRSQFVPGLEDQSRDWEIVLQESHHRGRLPRRHMDLHGDRQRHWGDRSAPGHRQPYPEGACAQHSRPPEWRSGAGRHSDLHRDAGYRLKIDGSHERCALT
jgi:hypothetical protein